jgi:hypothetical protein
MVLDSATDSSEFNIAHVRPSEWAMLIERHGEDRACFWPTSSSYACLRNGIFMTQPSNQAARFEITVRSIHRSLSVHPPDPPNAVRPLDAFQFVHTIDSCSAIRFSIPDNWHSCFSPVLAVFSHARNENRENFTVAAVCGTITFVNKRKINNLLIVQTI